MDNVTGQLRLTFGFEPLMKGFDFLIAVIGLFGIGEILLTMEEGLSRSSGKSAKIHPQGRSGRPGRTLPTLLGDLPPQLPGRLLDGHHAGRRDPRVVHGLWHRQTLLPERQELRQGRLRVADVVRPAGGSLVVNPGDMLRTTCVFDNLSEDMVTFGERTEDEMCFNFIAAYPAGAIATERGRARALCID
jgi:hypothetical protein